MSGTPVFRRSRVPIRDLFGQPAEGVTLDEYLCGFPTVEREQSVRALWLAGILKEAVAYRNAVTGPGNTATGDPALLDSKACIFESPKSWDIAAGSREGVSQTPDRSSEESLLPIRRGTARAVPLFCLDCVFRPCSSSRFLARRSSDCISGSPGNMRQPAAPRFCSLPQEVVGWRVMPVALLASRL